MNTKTEAKLMQNRTGLRAAAWEKWFQHIGATSITDLMRRYPKSNHAQATDLAISELEQFICG